MLHRRCLAGFELTSGSEYARDPNVIGFWKCIWFWYARVLNIPAFWICQSFEYKTGSEYNSILNIPGFWIYQGSLYISLVLTISGFWIYHGFWICQNSKYLRLLNIPGSEYASGCGYTRVLNLPWLHRVLNMSEFAWRFSEFFLHFALWPMSTDI